MLASTTRNNTVDYFCLKCSLILVEPVLLPCQHRFCLICINETIKANTLCCPYCLKRFGSWLRLKNATKTTNDLVDESIWNTIRKRFNDLLLNRTEQTTARKRINLSLSTKIEPDAEHFPSNSTKERRANWSRMKPIPSHSRQEAANTTTTSEDSINVEIEMALFRPIWAMPITYRMKDYKIMKIQPKRLKCPNRSAVNEFKPARSKFKKKLTSIHRRSAFYVVSPTPSTQTPAIVTTKQKAKTKSTHGCLDNDIGATSPKPSLPPPPPPPKSNRTKQNAQNQNNTTDQLQKNGRINGKIKKSNSPNGLNSKLLKLKQEQILLQEKEDFRLAQLFQQYEDKKHCESLASLGNGSTRYSLRSHHKMNNDIVLPRIANSAAPSDSTTSDTSSIMSDAKLLGNPETNTRARRAKRGTVENYYNLLNDDWTDAEILPRRTRNRH